mmetsp:Transcript_23197/g.73011  ORF Transcript_23197/g.73011 Transcript_23197/m.73011 type:complete len:271 (-) Transcript_23197:91-903(-)
MPALIGVLREVGDEVLVLDEDEPLGVPDDPEVHLKAVLHYRLRAHPHSVTRQSHAAELRIGRRPADDVALYGWAGDAVRHPPGEEPVSVDQVNLGIPVGGRLKGFPVELEGDGVGQRLVQRSETLDWHLVTLSALDAHTLLPGFGHVVALDGRHGDIHVVPDDLLTVCVAATHSQHQGPEHRWLWVLGALVLLPAAHGERAVDLPQRVGHCAEGAHGLCPNVALRLAVCPPTLDAYHGHLLRCCAVDPHHDVLPRLLVPRDVVLVHLHGH